MLTLDRRTPIKTYQRVKPESGNTHACVRLCECVSERLGMGRFVSLNFLNHPIRHNMHFGQRDGMILLSRETLSHTWAPPTPSSWSSCVSFPVRGTNQKHIGHLKCFTVQRRGRARQDIRSRSWEDLKVCRALRVF